jgi:hypothetical protein
VAYCQPGQQKAKNGSSSFGIYFNPADPTINPTVSTAEPPSSNLSPELSRFPPLFCFEKYTQSWGMLEIQSHICFDYDFYHILQTPRPKRKAACVGLRPLPAPEDKMRQMSAVFQLYYGIRRLEYTSNRAIHI